jgi:hypothetical protein
LSLAPTDAGFFFLCTNNRKKLRLYSRKGGDSMNEVWRLDHNFLAAYTEDEAIMRKIKRSYQMFIVMAKYYQDSKQIGVQYRVPNAKKRAAYRLFR